MPDDDPRLPWDESETGPDREVDAGDVPGDEEPGEAEAAAGPVSAGDLPAEEGRATADAGPVSAGDLPAEEGRATAAADVPADAEFVPARAADEESKREEAPAADVPADAEFVPARAADEESKREEAPAADVPADAEFVPASGPLGATDVPGDEESVPDAGPVGATGVPADRGDRSLASHADAPRPVAVGPGRHATGSAPSPESARTEARLAHIHLRTSMHALARAELETLAAHGSLDVPALADLAEVRWRTGDLVGAGEAADAYLEAGGDDLVVLCVAAEAAAAAGRMAAARHLAARVLARGRDRVEDLFAGQPRSNIWPELGTALPSAGVAAVPAPGARPARESASPILVASASSDLADAQARIARGDLSGIATRLALVLRVQPVLAPAILSVADQALRAPGAGPELASLHLVRGDAYRLMGRETLAGEAFQQSGRALRSSRRPED